MLVIYASDLEQYDIRDVRKACERIGRTEREDGETSFPTIGRIVAEVKEAKRIRDIAERVYVPRPEVKAALEANADKQRRIDAGEKLERFDVGGLISEGLKQKMLKEADEPVEVKPSPVCPHCKIAAIMIGDAVALRKMEAFYRDKAERAEAKLAEAAS